MNNIVAFRTPGDIVSVAKGVDLQGADVRGEESEVLSRRGEHVPRVEVKKRHQEVEAYGRTCGDDQVREDVVPNGKRRVGVLELRDDDVECCKGGVGHDDGVNDKTGHEHLFGPDGDIS